MRLVGPRKKKMSGGKNKANWLKKLPEKIKFPWSISWVQEPINNVEMHTFADVINNAVLAVVYVVVIGIKNLKLIKVY